MAGGLGTNRASRPASAASRVTVHTVLYGQAEDCLSPQRPPRTVEAVLPGLLSAGRHRAPCDTPEINPHLAVWCIMSRDILVCMVRAREWRRQLYSIIEPGSTGWVADQSIELTEGESLDAIWVTVNARSTALANDPNGAQGILPINQLGNVMRVGFLWVDNPITIVDPLSSLADPLWVSQGLWDWRPIMALRSVPNFPEEIRQEWIWSASWKQEPVKAEGKRTIGPGEGSRWITFNGFESGGSFSEFGTHGVFQAIVSAIVLLPGEA